MRDVGLLALYVVGFLIAAAGFWLAWPPLGLVALGAGLCVGAQRLAGGS